MPLWLILVLRSAAVGFLCLLLLFVCCVLIGKSADEDHDRILSDPEFVSADLRGRYGVGVPERVR